MYKVFFNESMLVLAEKGKVSEAEFPDYFVHKYPCDIHEITQKLCSSKTIEYHLLIGENLAILIDYFEAEFQVIEAAGGVVTNPEKEILFIRRLDKWDLPKGKMEKGEDQKETALREVREECGLKDIRLGNKIQITRHTYLTFRKPILKRTHWYSMNIENDQAVFPQQEEGITEAKWFSIDQIHIPLADTWSSIRLVMKTFPGTFVTSQYSQVKTE